MHAQFVSDFGVLRFLIPLIGDSHFGGGFVWGTLATTQMFVDLP